MHGLKLLRRVPKHPCGSLGFEGACACALPHTEDTRGTLFRFALLSCILRLVICTFQKTSAVGCTRA